MYSNTPPSDEQEKKFIDFLKQRYNEDISLVWKKTDIPEGGFKLKVGSEVFDWSIDGRLAQFKEALSKLKSKDFYCLIVGSDQGRVHYTNELKELVSKYSLM